MPPDSIVASKSRPPEETITSTPLETTLSLIVTVRQGDGHLIWKLQLSADDFGRAAFDHQAFGHAAREDEGPAAEHGGCR